MYNIAIGPTEGATVYILLYLNSGSSYLVHKTDQLDLPPPLFQLPTESHWGNMNVFFNVVPVKCREFELHTCLWSDPFLCLFMLFLVAIINFACTPPLKLPTYCTVYNVHGTVTHKILLFPFLCIRGTYSLYTARNQINPSTQNYICKCWWSKFPKFQPSFSSYNLHTSPTGRPHRPNRGEWPDCTLYARIYTWAMAPPLSPPPPVAD